jgi:hypothetical protein
MTERATDVVLARSTAGGDFAGRKTTDKLIGSFMTEEHCYVR